MKCWFILMCTNLSHEFFSSFVWKIFLRIGETMIWEDWTRYKSSSLGMPKAPQVNISRSLKHLSLGMLRIPPLFINNYRLAYVEPKFLFVHMMRAILGVLFFFCLLFNKKLKILNSYMRESSHSYLVVDYALIFTYIILRVSKQHGNLLRLWI